MIKVKDIYDFIGEISPYDYQCEWDNCGLLVGDVDKEVRILYSPTYDEVLLFKENKNKQD